MRGEGGWDVRGGQRQHRGKATDVMQHNPQVVLSFSLHLLLAQSHTHTCHSAPPFQIFTFGALRCAGHVLDLLTGTLDLAPMTFAGAGWWL